MAEHGRRDGGRQSDDAFYVCAAMVLPYLNSAELASISSTCRRIYQLTKSINSRRVADSSRGIEALPIPYLNPNPAEPYSYSYFLYTATQTLRLRPQRQPWGSDNDARICGKEGRPDPFLFRIENASGCDCASCDVDSCPCFKTSESLLCRECGPSCNCDSACANRVTQRGVTARLKIVKNKRKGWGLYAAELIPAGRFICEYAGELLSTEEARRRQQAYDELSSSAGHFSPALLVVKEHLPSGNTCMRINIDATRIGNIARFINHSCDGGNLDTAIVRSCGALLPRVCFFASRDIGENEELTFSYGDVRLNGNVQRCFCGASSCAGVLPSERT